MFKGGGDFASSSRVQDVLTAFSRPKTPRQVEKELSISKLKVGPYMQRKLLVPLNPDAKKGRLYVLSQEGRRIVTADCAVPDDVDWNTVGWVVAGSRQRYVVLTALDAKERTSEEIRRRASRYNNRLWRVSTKEILADLVDKTLAATKLQEMRRYYWITSVGYKTLSHLEDLFPLSCILGNDPGNYRKV